MIAFAIHVRGVVQGVGFRPFVYRLAQELSLTGWVLNGEDGVEMHIEGNPQNIAAFLQRLKAEAPPAARISDVEVHEIPPEKYPQFKIYESHARNIPTVCISPDLPVCEDCLKDLFDPANLRCGYPYINCTNCGPRYSVVLALPYDRPNTTMKGWPLDEFCKAEYLNPANRRFHAQPVACPTCGPNYFLELNAEKLLNGTAIRKTAELLQLGSIVAVKGIGGYHLACDARNPESVDQLRGRKFRKEQPFAVMAKSVGVAHSLVDLSEDEERLLASVARPIILARAKECLQGVAPNNNELGVMLPYTPLHHLLFHAGAPEALVMTSANRSSEPIAYEDHDALHRLAGIADAFLIGERPIARRVDDSVVRVSPYGPAILRRSRGYSPGAVCSFPASESILAVGADLKNAITLVVEGQAFVSQHIGDLSHHHARHSFAETIQDLLTMYEVLIDDLLVVHDSHPQYISTQHALTLNAPHTVAIQHHRAHIASVLAERGEWDRRVLGISFDGTGYGDDGTIWGGEFFIGSVSHGFQRVAHLRPAALPGGDAAAQYPVQAAAGFLSQLDGFDFKLPPFNFPARFRDSMRLVQKDVRCFITTSMGRLFDAAAALLGFTRETTFEGQAAMWLEHLASKLGLSDFYPFPLIDDELDFRPLLEALILDRLRGRDCAEIARAFQSGVAVGLHSAAHALCRDLRVDVVALSGGVFQNRLLLQDLKNLFTTGPYEVWTNSAVPANDGGISLGQAAIAALGKKESTQSARSNVFSSA
jgi:hydrogenase maturation protein HypF